MVALFWISAAIVAYVYVGYPCLIALWARIVDRRPYRARFAEGHWPSISVIIAARDEAPRLPARVRSLLDQAYPGRCEIIVVSDGSTDDPESALAPFGDAVRVVELPAGGKPLALNAGVQASTGDILVFADARQRFADGALMELVSNFGTPASAAPPASWCSTASTPARATARSARASASIGSTRNGCVGTRAASGRRSAPRARFTRSGARAGRPFPLRPCSTTCWSPCARS